MAIVLRNPQEALLYSTAGKLIGEAASKKEEYRRATEIADKLFAVKAQQEMTVFNNQLDLDRMKYAQLMNFEEEKRAKAWELEKMEIRSKTDFAEEESKRTKRLNEYELGTEQIKKLVNEGSISVEEQIKLETDLYFDKIVGAPGVSYPKPETEKQIFTQAKIQQVLGALTTGSPVSPMGIALPTLTAKKDKEAYIINELGPNWREIAPQAISLVEGKVQTPSPYKEYPDAINEGGRWFVYRNGQKFEVVK